MSLPSVHSLDVDPEASTSMTTLAPAIDEALASRAEEYARNLVFYVNQQRFEIENPDPRVLLVDFLRSTEVGLTGTKHSCGQGGCGACTVTLSRYDEARERVVVHTATNSCLRPLCALDGMQVTTVEGLGRVNTEVNPVQYEIAKCNGSQCGYCTPGFVMNMHSLLLENEHRDLSSKEIEDAFDGNICRCTGFRPILYAMKQFAFDRDQREDEGTPECLVDPAMDVEHYKRPRADFPDELKRPARAVAYGHRGHRYECLWFRPLNLEGVLALMQTFSDHEVKLVVGNTTVGIPDVNPRDPDVYIDIAHVAELHKIRPADDHLVVGAAVTYTQLLDVLDELLRDEPDAERTAGLEALHYMARRTAGMIVRNVASLAGNTMLVARNATQDGTPFPSDLFTALCALDARVVVRLPDGESRPLGMLEFVEAYNAEEGFGRQAVILRYEIPYTAAGDHVTTYKVALREVNSHSLVNAGLRITIGEHRKIERAALVFGAIAPVAFHARKTEEYLTGKAWGPDTYEEAQRILMSEIREIQAGLPAWFRELPYDGSCDAYRLSLAESFLYKFYVQVSGVIDPNTIPDEDRSAGERSERKVSWGTQTFAAPSEGPAAGQPFIKLSAFEQATGEALYTHDLPLPVRGVQGSFVTSTAAYANFWYQIPDRDGSTYSVDVDALIDHLRTRFGREFVDYITSRDIPAGGVKGVTNTRTPPTDPWFCEESVACFGQCIGLVVAESESAANDIAAYVRDACIEYRHHEPVVLDIEAAIARKQFFEGYDKDDNHSLETPGFKDNSAWTKENGRVDVGGVPCEVIHGEQHTGSQIHFYMETQSCLAIPGEGPEIVVHSSTQSQNSVQGEIHMTLAVQANQVEVDIKRLGGAYGGKTTRTPFVAVPAALAASKLRRPVRVAMPRDVDSWMIGCRHPFLGRFSMAIACDGDGMGKLMGSATDFFSNGGNTIDCSFDVMDCAQLGADNSYNVPYFFTRGEVCRTNIHSNGAMRSYGGIQAMLIQEEALEAAAHKIGMSPEAVREMNFYETGDTTPFGQQLEYCYIREVWDRLKTRSDFVAREQLVKDFNVKNRWRKRGISMIPLKYGLGYNLGFLMQGGALVDVYTADATVLVEIGGVEMGQGLMTKVAQVAARELNVPLNLIRMGSTQTNVVPDSIGTGATSGTDLSGGAVQQACQELRDNLEQLCHRLEDENGNEWCRTNGIDYWNHKNGWRTVVDTKGTPTLMWNNVVGMAFTNRVDLSAQALYSTPGMVDGTDQQFYGFTYSAACSEVEIDVLTGETTVVRSDICYDMGESINPAIDIGQIEGAFVMGIGYVLTEDLIFQPHGTAIGRNNTPNTWTYKPPATTTIPVEMHVDLFPRDDAPGVPQNPNLLMGSKGVGEPPLVLAASVFFAVKHAALSARQDKGLDDWFPLESPATVERVRAACVGGFEAAGASR